MLRMKDEYYRPVLKDIERFFFDMFWRDILKALDQEDIRLNSRSVLISAIRSGRIYYSNGVFRGSFSAAISKELSKFAKYNGVKKVWEGMAPPDVAAAAAVVNNRTQGLIQKIESLIAEIPARVDAAIQDLQYSIEKPLDLMNEQADRDLYGLGLRPEMTQELRDRLLRDYKTNMDLNIKNWEPVQIERLRGMMERAVLTGYSRPELVKSIQSEFEVSRNKAKFLARQETSLYMAQVRDSRYQESGIDIVKWSNSNDIRVVGNPSGKYPEPSEGHGNHWKLGGKYCSLKDPTVYADTMEDAKAGNWKSKASIGAGNSHAGEEFGCRCSYIPQI